MIPDEKQSYHYLELHHTGDCRLLGVSPAGDVYVEEIYGDDDWFAQHHFDVTGDTIASVDENGGAVADVGPLTLPDDLVKPGPVQAMTGLNFVGPRLRGMRETDRVSDMALSLSVADKMALAQTLGLGMPLGLGESRVLAEAVLEDGVYFVCRRVRFLVALPETRHDSAGEPYDYDSVTRYIGHSAHPDDDPTTGLVDALAGWRGVRLHRPMDCLVHNGRFYIADGGDESRRSGIHIWQS